MISPVAVLGCLFLMLMACYFALCVLYTVDFVIWLAMERDKLEPMKGEVMKPNVKPGYQTTEFWSMCGVQLSAFIVALSSADSSAKIVSGMTAAGAILAYFWTRHQVKMTAMKTPSAAAPAVLPMLLAFVLFFGFGGLASAQHHPASLFGIAEQRQIERLQKQLADQNAAQIAALNAQLQANLAAQNQLLIAFMSQQRQQSPAPVAPQATPQTAPQIIQYHIHIPGAPKMDPSPGTPKLDPAPGVPQLNPNPGVPKLDPAPGVPQIIINPGVPKLNPNPGAPIPINPLPGQPGPGTSSIPGYQIYSDQRPIVTISRSQALAWQPR